MKISLRILIVVTALLAGPLVARATTASPEKARACLNAFKKWPGPTSETSARCMDLARNIEKTEGLTGRALYLLALSYELKADEDPQSFERLSSKLNEYFSRNIEPYLRPERLENISTTALQDTFEGLRALLFYSSIVRDDGFAIEQTRQIFNALLQRGEVNLDSAKAMLNIYEKNSLWTKAREFGALWPALEPVIGTSGKVAYGELGFYTLSNDLQSMELKTAHTSSGAKIVIFGDCHFAIEAVETLGADPEISSIMKSNGLVIAPPANFDAQQIAELRTKHPSFEIHPLHGWGAWFQKGFDVTKSPSFVFLLDGQLKYRFSGMNPDLKQTFCVGLNSIGIGAGRACDTAP